jgi:hypothetical protein
MQFSTLAILWAILLRIALQYIELDVETRVALFIIYMIRLIHLRKAFVFGKRSCHTITSLGKVRNVYFYTHRKSETTSTVVTGCKSSSISAILGKTRAILYTISTHTRAIKEPRRLVNTVNFEV